MYKRTGSSAGKDTGSAVRDATPAPLMATAHHDTTQGARGRRQRQSRVRSERWSLATLTYARPAHANMRRLLKETCSYPRLSDFP